MTRILILGGTTEATALAAACASLSIQAVFSYAGRVDRPRQQPVETRVGGFGGVEGLMQWMADSRITHLVDATHPFAVQMSLHAIHAARRSNIPFLALEREPWTRQEGDRWNAVADIESAVDALSGPRRSVFLAIGRMHLASFARQPQHRYLLRLVDPPLEPLPFPDAVAMVDRGPFRLETDLELLRAHAIDCVVAKNSGGEGARSKVDAARMLGIGIVMIERPVLPARPVVSNVAEVMRWLGHGTDLGV